MCSKCSVWILYGVCRKELDKLLPEEFRRFDVADKSYVKSQAGSYSAQAASEPPPRRITVMEPPVDHRADPVTGYAKLGYAGQVCHLLSSLCTHFFKVAQQSPTARHEAFASELKSSCGSPLMLMLSPFCSCLSASLHLHLPSPSMLSCACVE